MAYITQPRGRSLTQLYVLKFHVLTDLFSILESGKAIIGGSVAPWELGPVVVQAYRTCARWTVRFDRHGDHPTGLRVTHRNGNKITVRTAGPVDLDDFSQVEINAMERAWTEIGKLNVAQLVHYTHSPDTFLGEAYCAALRENRLMDWDEIVASYDRHRGEDHSAIRRLIQL